MALIDEISKYREEEIKEKQMNSIININDDSVIDTMYKCMVKYIKDHIIFYVKTEKDKYNKFVGFVFVNNLCDSTTLKEMEEFFRYIESHDVLNSVNNSPLYKLPLTICFCSRPADIIPNVYYIDNKITVSQEDAVKLIGGRCNSCTDCSSIIYKYNDNICLYPLAYTFRKYPPTQHNIKNFDGGVGQKFTLQKSVTNNYDNLILKLSELLKKWFDQEGLINNTVNIKSFDQIIPIKKIPCYKTGLFGKKLVNEKELIPSNCNNKVITFEVEW